MFTCAKTVMRDFPVNAITGFWWHQYLKTIAFSKCMARPIYMLVAKPHAWYLHQLNIHFWFDIHFDGPVAEDPDAPSSYRTVRYWVLFIRPILTILIGSHCIATTGVVCQPINTNKIVANETETVYKQHNLDLNRIYTLFTCGSNVYKCILVKYTKMTGDATRGDDSINLLSGIKEWRKYKYAFNSTSTTLWC